MKTFLMIGKKGDSTATCTVEVEGKLPNWDCINQCEQYLNKKDPNIGPEKYVIIDFKEIAND